MVDLRTIQNKVATIAGHVGHLTQCAGELPGLLEAAGEVDLSDGRGPMGVSLMKSSELAAGVTDVLSGAIESLAATAKTTTPAGKQKPGKHA